jgi:hypothetical protein
VCVVRACVKVFGSIIAAVLCAVRPTQAYMRTLHAYLFYLLAVSDFHMSDDLSDKLVQPSSAAVSCWTRLHSVRLHTLWVHEG